MTDPEQTDAFAKALDALVDRYRREFNLTYAQAVGVLVIKMHELCAETEEE